MLKKADNILKILEDPEGNQGARESPTEESAEDVTPVFAAQVFVPNAGSDDALAAAVSAMESGILQDQANSVPIDNLTPVPPTPMNVEQNQENQDSQPGSSTNATSQNAGQPGPTNQLPE